MSEDGSHGESIDQVFGANLREARTWRGLTQEGVARMMQKRGFDFHQATVYKIESGKRSVSVGESFALAEVLDAPIAELTRSRHDSLRSEMARLDLEALKITSRLRRIREAVRDLDPIIGELLANARHVEKLFEQEDGEVSQRYAPLKEARDAMHLEQVSAFLDSPDAASYDRGGVPGFGQDSLF
ncbi:helix-turn-helix transcriptional regulator [Curtobacterium flaccumfaciens]|uniref:helix-turn-helix transcriptional regulator n=1 Tax=Curtobacterium flaccumfaciens TaxID=2035 RepID=UPI003D9A7A1D